MLALIGLSTHSYHNSAPLVTSNLATVVVVAATGCGLYLHVQVKGYLPWFVPVAPLHPLPLSQNLCCVFPP